VIFPCCVDVISNISSLPEQSKRGFIAPARDLPRHAVHFPLCSALFWIR
jgi:hypothetical protein